MYTEGVFLHGQRGLFAPVSAADVPTMTETEVAAYGVEFFDRLPGNMSEDQQAEEVNNLFDTYMPDQMPYVEVPEVRCPFTQEQVILLRNFISSLPYIHMVEMDAKAEVWIRALQFCRDLASN
jgi:hypothetical protein